MPLTHCKTYIQRSGIVTTILLCCIILMASALPAPAARQVPDSREEVQLSYAPIVKQASPAVVNIYTSRRVKVRSGISPLLNDPFFRQFFKHRFAPAVREREINSLGSGVIVDRDGLVITSLHVVEKAEDIRLVLPDKREFGASLVLEDAASDLALLQIDGEIDEPLTALPIVSSDTLDVGDLVLAIGNPFGVGQTVTSGIVSGLARSAAGVSDYSFFIQTDAAINPGNSGGPLVNMRGELVGINTAIFSRSGGSMGIGFAIPSNVVNAFLRNRREDGSIIRPWLGATYRNVTPEIAESLDLSAIAGALVEDIRDNSPARRAGLQAGDVILSFNKAPIDSADALDFRIATAPIQTSLPLTYWRSGSTWNTRITLQDQPQPEIQTEQLTGNHPLSGITVATMQPALARRFDLPSGKNGVAVLKQSQQRGQHIVKPGDIITHISGERIETVRDLKDALNRNRRDWRLRLLRGNRQIQLRIAR